MKHKHHIIPKHFGGSDDPSNLVEVSVEEHANLHLALYLEHGRWQDAYAAWFLCGRMGEVERIRCMKLVENNKTNNPMKDPKVAQKSAENCRKWWDNNPEAKVKVAERQRRYATGRKQTKEDRLKKSEAAKRRWADPDKRKKQAEAVRKSWILRRLNTNSDE